MYTIRRLNLSKITKNKLATYIPLLKQGFVPLFEPPNLLDPKNKSLVVFSAEIDKNPVGLLIATSMRDKDILEIQSLFAIPGEQASDIRLKIVDALTHYALDKKYRMLIAVYAAQAPFLEEWECTFIQSNWDGKRVVMLDLYFDDCQQFHPPWLEKNYSLDPGFEMFSWKDLTPEEAESIKQARENGAIPLAVYPFAGDASFEPLTSVGLRYKGEVVAWMITRLVAPDTLCYNALYSDYDLQMKGYAILLLIDAVKRQQRLSPYRKAIVRINMLDVSTSWIRFVRRRGVPYASKSTEYCQAWRQLKPEVRS